MFWRGLLARQSGKTTNGKTNWFTPIEGRSMKVNLIKEYQHKFHNYLSRGDTSEQRYKYENLQNFRQSWDIEELDFHTMYDNSFRSKISNRLWGGTHNSGREMMLRFIEQDKEFVRSMYRDLLDENKTLNLRVDRFKFHCDELLSIMQRKDKKLDRHFHSSPQLPFLYLCFHDPSTYPLYDLQSFNKALKLFEARSEIQPFEIERYQKLSKSIYTIISKDDSLISLHGDVLRKDFGIEWNMLGVHDFIQFCSSS